MIRKRYYPLCFVFILWSRSLCLAIDPQLSADETSFDIATQTLNAKGDALFVHDDLIINADSIQYRRKDNEALLTGNTRLTHDSLRLISERVIYDADNELIDTNAFRLGGYGVFAQGTGLRGTTSRVNLSNTIFYVDEPETFGINLKARSVRLITNDRIEADHLFLRIGKVPFFYLPKYRQALAQAPLEFKGDVGFRGDLGGFVQTETRVPLSESLSAGGLLDFYSERGTLVGPSIRYRKDFADPDMFIKSKLWGGFIKDNGDRDEDVLGRAIAPRRDFLEYRHQQRLRENWSVTSSLSIWSDSEVLRDFRNDAYKDNQQPDNFVETVYTGEDYLLSAFARFDPNDFQVIQQRLPELRFDRVLNPFPIEGFYHSYSAAFARLEEDPLDSADEELDSDRFDFRYTLYRPFKPNRWLSVTPVVGSRVTYYDDTLDSRSNYTRVMGELGFDAEMVAHRVWRYENKLWNIQDFRHVVRPIFRYRYLPGGKYGDSSIIPIDDATFTTSLPSIDLSNIRFIDDLTDLHVARFGLENLLQTRRSGYGSRDLVELSFYQDLNFSGNEEGREWADFYTQLKLKPIYWFNFNVYQRFNPEDLSHEETRTEIRLIDGDLQELRVSNISLQNEINQYNLRYIRKFNEKWSGSLDYRFDTRRDGLVDQRYSLEQRLGNSWLIAYQLDLTSGSEREDNTGFRVRFDFIGF